MNVIDSKIPTVCSLRAPIPIQIDNIVNLFDSITYIAEGAYGKVYSAIEKSTGEIVALKQMIDSNLTVVDDINREFKELKKTDEKWPMSKVFGLL